MLRARQRDFAIRGRDPVEAMRQLIATVLGAVEHQEVIALLNSETFTRRRHITLAAHPRTLRSAGRHVRELLDRGAAEASSAPTSTR